MQIGKESIFGSSMRAFCVAFFTIIGVSLALIALFTGFSLLSTDQMTGTYDWGILPDDEGIRRDGPPTLPVVLWVNIEGEIGLKHLVSQEVQELLSESREGDFRGDRVKALMLHINSPGGTADDSENIYNLIKEYKARYNVPVYAYVDGLCASGGMLIACSADRIYATPSSVVGSVGVISNFFNATQLLDKIGVQSLVLTQGKGKDALFPFRPWQPGEDKNITDVMENLYGGFVDIVTAARTKITKQDLIENYGAQVYAAPLALEYGYIDAVALTPSLALKELAQAASINGPYQVVELYQNSWVVGLFSEKSPLFSGQVLHKVEMPSRLHPEMANKFLYLYAPAS